LTRVDSRKGKAMADELGDLVGRVQTALKSGFDGVDEAFVDQRLRTELTLGRLESKIDARLARLEQKVDCILALQQTPIGSAESG